MELSTSTNGSIAGQTNTQSPQVSAGSGSAPTADAKNVQPGTANSVLMDQNSANGIQLNPTSLPIVNLNTSTQTASALPAPSAKVQHHVNAALLIIAAVLLLCAVGFTWQTARSAKNTT